MRLRQLGHGQSVTFIIPQDVAANIREVGRIGLDVTIKVTDILFWSVKNTWAEIQSNVNLWAMQGKRYESHKGLFHGAETTKEQIQQFLEDGDQYLETRYRPRSTDGPKVVVWDATNKDSAEIISRLQRHGMKAYDDMQIDAEQEVGETRRFGIGEL